MNTSLSIILLIPFLIMTCLLDQVRAFSLGPIKIISRFGERLHAEIIVDTENKDGLQAIIGSEEDYAMLELTRPDILNDIHLTLSALPDLQKQLITLSSDKFLFYPSFDLVVKATFAEGIIIEKYLLTMDFKKNLSVSMVSDPPPPSLPNKKSVPIQKEDFSRTTTIARTQTISPTEPPKNKKKKPSVKPPRDLQPQPKIINKKIAPLPEVTLDPLIQRYGPVKRGETLYAIAEHLPFEQTYSADTIVVALWRENKRKFVRKNLNGLMEGAILTYSSLEKILPSILPKEAKRIIAEQTVLWRKKASSKNDLDPKNNKYSLIHSPDKKTIGIDKIRSFITQWKESWEKKDMEQMISFYSPRFKSNTNDRNQWMTYKKKFNARHNNISIAFDNLEVLPTGEETTYLSFLQYFHSDEMNSIGLKTLTLTKTTGRWLIEDEHWNGNIRASKNSPYVIHVASVAMLKGAVYETNRWRKQGYNAYFSFVQLPGKGAWYRVFINRFSYKILAKYFSHYIKNKKLARYAQPLYLPFAIDGGTHNTYETATTTIDKIIAGNAAVSPFLFIYNKQKPDTSNNTITYNVLLGAYGTEGLAEQAAKELANDTSTTYKVVRP